MLGKHQTEYQKQRARESNTGVNHWNWKGDDGSHDSIHHWLRSHYGRADRCENELCPGISKQFDYALLPGHKYSRKRTDYIKLCRSCHKKMDMTDEIKKKISKGLTKWSICIIENCNTKATSQGYCMHHYNTIYRKLP